MKNQNSQIVIYKDQNGNVKIDVRFDGNTVWLAQNAMAELFQTTKQNISQHIKNIFEEREMRQDATVKKFFTAQKELKTDSNSVVKNFFTTAVDGKSVTLRTL